MITVFFRSADLSLYDLPKTINVGETVVQSVPRVGESVHSDGQSFTVSDVSHMIGPPGPAPKIFVTLARKA